jgi:hypothetical protein
VAAIPRLGQIFVPELARQIGNQPSLLAHQRFQLGDPCLQFRDARITLAASLTPRVIHATRLPSILLAFYASLARKQ